MEDAYEGNEGSETAPKKLIKRRHDAILLISTNTGSRRGGRGGGVDKDLVASFWNDFGI